MRIKASISAFLFLVCLIIISCPGGTATGALKNENTFTFGFEAMPKSLNFLIDYNSFSILVAQLLYESLCDVDLDTWQVKPRLAESWTVSEDKMTYTFVLDKDAQWADGSPVTSEDVMFTYNTIMDPKNLTSIFRSDFESAFEQVYAPDVRTIVFKAKTKRWSNFISAYSFTVLPKKQFEGKDFNKEFNLWLPPGSGPYELEKVEQDRFIQMKKRDDFWCKKLPNKKNIYTFQHIKYKFISAEEIRIEALKKGELDFLFLTRAKDWIELTVNNPPEQMKKNWILAKRVWNHMPQGYQGFHLNLRREKLKDLGVRKALAYLLNFDLINEKIMLNQYIRLRSYFPSYFNSDDDLPLFQYNPDEARKLLTAAGWDRVDKDGVLINSKGERFEIEFLYDSQSLERHITIYKEDCAKVGIRINLILVSPAAFRKKVFEDHDFDITWMAWGQNTLFPGVEDGWKSDRADESNSNNVVGYKNAGLDRLIDQYLEEYDIPRRKQLLKAIDKILTNDVPTILLWGGPYVRMLYWNRYDMLATILKKHDDGWFEDSIYTNWRLDPQKVENLKKALQNNTPLPAEPVDIYFDAQVAPQK